MTTPTLVERLGYGADQRLLIVNCDDLGSSHSANVAIFRSMVYGIATSATLMAPCAWAREAVQMLKGRAIGVHLTLTCEYAGYRWRGLTDARSLHDAEGYLPRTAREALQNADAEEARAEYRAQIEAALDWGVDVTHIDAHMGVARARLDLADVYLDLAEEFRLPVRMDPPERFAAVGAEVRRRAEARGLVFNEHLLHGWPRFTRDILTEALPNLRPGVTEVFGHPVQDGEELRAYDTDNAEIRVQDAAFFTDPEIAAQLDAHDVKRISFRDLRELQRAGG